MKSRSTCPSCKAILEFDRAAVSAVKCPKCAHQGEVADFPEIPTRSVQCPHCKTSLKIAKDTKNKNFVCPKCKRSITVEDEAEMSTDGPDSLTDKNKLYRPGKLEMLKDDGLWQSPERTVALARGVNTLGRKSAKSASSIQLSTADNYMSKNHAKIEVVMAADSSFAHQLSDAGSTNGTYHNDERLEKGQVNYLKLGDTVRMGHTVFRFAE